MELIIISNRVMILHIDDGSMGWGGPIPHEDPVTDSYDKLSSSGEEWLYDNKFDNERKGIFHYCIICQHIQGTESRGHGEYHDDEFTLAGNRISGTDAWCHVFMHELGHNLGLIHYDTPKDHPFAGNSCMLSWEEKYGYYIDYTEDEWKLIDLTHISKLNYMDSY